MKRTYEKHWARKKTKHVTATIQHSHFILGYDLIVRRSVYITHDVRTVYTLSPHTYTLASSAIYFNLNILYKALCHCNGLLFEAFSLLLSSTFTSCSALSTHCLKMLRNSQILRKFIFVHDYGTAAISRWFFFD